MRTLNLTNEPLRGLFFIYLSANIFGTLITAFYILADTIIIGRSLGSSGLAALDLSLPVYNLFTALGTLLGLGSAISYATGGGRNKSVIGQALTLGVISAFLCFGLGQFYLVEILRIFGAEGNLVPFTADYLRGLFRFIPFLIFAVLLGTLVNNDGAPQVAMWGLAAGSFVNLVLDLWFINGLGWGMGGAALATGLGAALNCLILLCYTFSKACSLPFTLAKLRLEEMAIVLRKGFPGFIVEFAAGLAFLLFNRELLRFSGKAGVAAFGIIANVSLVCSGIFTGIGQAAQPIISVNYGAGKWRRVVKTRNFTLLIAFLAGLSLFALGQLFALDIVEIFLPRDPEFLVVAVEGLTIFLWALVPMGLNIGLGFYFQALGFSDHAINVALARGGFFILLGLLLLPQLYGLKGVWLIVPLGEILTLFLSFLLIFT